MVTVAELSKIPEEANTVGYPTVTRILAVDSALENRRLTVDFALEKRASIACVKIA